MLLLFALDAGSAHATWQPNLSQTEIALASKLAVQHTTEFNKHSRAVANDTTELGVEILLIELQEKKKNGVENPRIAETFVFDYFTGKSWQHLVNLDTSEQLSSRPLPDSYLPLNDNETDVVIRLVKGNSTVVAMLEDEYQSQFGSSLTDLTVLDMKVSVWPSKSNSHGNPCALSRCGLVSIFTTQHYNFSVEPIVDLMTGQVYPKLLLQE